MSSIRVRVLVRNCVMVIFGVLNRVYVSVILYLIMLKVVVIISFDLIWKRKLVARMIRAKMIIL